MPRILVLPNRTSLLSITETAERLGVSRTEVFRRMNQKLIPARKYIVKGQHQWRIRPADLERHREQRLGEVAASAS